MEIHSGMFGEIRRGKSQYTVVLLGPELGIPGAFGKLASLPMSFGLPSSLASNGKLFAFYSPGLSTCSTCSGLGCPEFLKRQEMGSRNLGTAHVNFACDLGNRS